MGTTENIQAWSKTANSNTTADAGINWAEGQDPGTVNNSARGMMAAVKKFAEDTGGGLAAGGTGNAITVTTNQALSSGQIAAGLTLTFRATATNTGAVTFAPDSLTAVAVVDQFGAALAAGAITSGGIYTVTYNANTSKWVLQTPAVIPVAAIPTSGTGAPGMVLLTSGTVSSASTLDIVLTSYTGYRALKFVLTKFIPATDGDNLYVRFSTDGGSNYDAGASDYSGVKISFNSSSGTGSASGVGATTSVISIAASVGSASTEGLDSEIVLFDYESTARYSRLQYQSTFMNSANPTSALEYYTGNATRRAAQNTDAIRFLFSSGNISSGAYAVFGLL